MINIRPLIQSRIASQVAAAKEVAGASSMADVLKGRLTDKGIYIVPFAERADANSRVNAVVQRHAEQFSVLFVVHNVRDPRGADASDACFALRASAQSALLGWVPDASCEMLEKVSGRLVSFANGFYIWQDIYQTAQFIRAV